MKDPVQPEMMDAYTRARRVAPGCTHQLACRCEAPYWLRPPTTIELAREEHMRRPFISTEGDT